MKWLYNYVIFKTFWIIVKLRSWSISNFNLITKQAYMAYKSRLNIKLKFIE